MSNAPWKTCMERPAREPVLLCSRTTKAWAVRLLIKKKAPSRENVISLCKSQNKHDSSSRLIWEARHPEKKENAGFCFGLFFCFFIHAKLLLESLPSIPMAGSWRKHNTGNLFIPLDVSVLIFKVNVHSGQRELDSCYRVAVKSKLWDIVWVTL